MNRQQKLAKLQKEAPSEIPAFLKAAKLYKEMDGLSITGDAATYKEIEKVLNFTPATKEGLELKKSLLTKSKETSKAGMDGKGTFFIN